MAEYEPIEFVDQANPLKGNPDAPRLNAANLAKMQTQYGEVLAEAQGGVGPIGEALRATFTPADRPEWATPARPYDPRLDVFNLRPDNMSKFRAARARAAGGLGTLHITAFLDSIMYGAAASGVSQPKPTNAIYGRLGRMLKERYGDAGSGIIVPWDTLASTPVDDPRLVITGDVPTHAFGPHNLGCLRWQHGSGANFVTFTETCTEFVLYMLGGGSRVQVQVDGGTVHLIAGTPNIDTSLTDYDPEPGYQSNGNNGQIVTVVPAGSLGSHTIKIMAPSNGTNFANLIGVEGRTGTPGVRVSGMSRSGISSGNLVVDDPVNFLGGMACSIDMPKADLAVLLLGMNDYQGHQDVSTFKSRITTAVERQKSSASLKANGDVLLVTCPQPDYGYPIPDDGVLTPPLTDYYTALYEVADEQDVPLLDIGRRWRDFDTSDALGYFGDPLHPNDLGSEDIARAIFNVLEAV